MAALDFALVETGWRVLFSRTTDLVQRLQVVRRELTLEAAIAKLDKYRLLILGDLAYVTTDQPETSVLFNLTSAGYERHLGDAPTRLGSPTNTAPLTVELPAGDQFLSIFDSFTRDGVKWPPRRLPRPG